MRFTLLLAVLALSACSTVGPPRPTLAQALSSEAETPPTPKAPAPCVEVDGTPMPCGPVMRAMSDAPGDGTEGVGNGDTLPAESMPSATPFSAGIMVGAGLFLDGTGRVMPAQLAVGSVKVASLGPRAFNVLALGGLSGTSISQARAAWGGGVALEVTPGTLPYEVAASVGVLWVKGEDRPALLGGFTLTPKM